ncbi:MAG: response regulator transcription factor [Rhizobium sp.]|nr:response regulator transcription factor [Rhizobium sp.]
MRQLAPHVAVGSALSATQPQQMPHLRTLLFVGPSDLVSGAMAAAIQREFPFLVVSQSVDIRSALEEFDIPLRLLLVDVPHLNELNACVQQLLAQHPTLILAIVTDSDLRETAERLHALDTQHIHGILPLNVSLDILLSMLRIILKGGTYFPSITFKAREVTTRPAEESSNRDAVKAGLELEARSKVMGQLTKRENEILTKIALGNQNKIIASALGLSEHTVKIHIHNIIRKLGVHNRTEAVALYFDYKEKSSGKPGIRAERSGSNSAHHGDA